MKEYSNFTRFLLISVIVFLFESCSSADNSKKGESIKSDSIKYKVTFIELGSVRCIPCQQMQPVMKSIEAKYGKMVKVVFHDVWTEAGAPFAKQYSIEAIPTQVFLDENSREFFRHTGFFPEEELVKVLNSKGIQ